MIHFILGLALTSAFAAQPPTTSYDCRIMIFAQDLLPAGTEAFAHNFPVLATGSHGGDPTEFTAGEHKVGIIADAKWRGIIWQRAGKDVAQVLTAATKPIEGNAVIILTNPANLEEAVHLVCDALPGDFPTQ